MPPVVASCPVHLESAGAQRRITTEERAAIVARADELNTRIVWMPEQYG